jgi:hypothetical protein
VSRLEDSSVSGPDVERHDVVPTYGEDDLDGGYVDRLADQTKVDRGSVALVLGQHLANQHALEHVRPGRPSPFPPNMGGLSAGTVAAPRTKGVQGIWERDRSRPLTDEELAVLARETEGL